MFFICSQSLKVLKGLCWDMHYYYEVVLLLAMGEAERQRIRMNTIYHTYAVNTIIGFYPPLIMHHLPPVSRILIS